MSNNNQNFNRNQFDTKELVEGLNRTSVPMTLKATIWTDTTPKLASKVMSIISDDFSIPEIDQVFIYPIENKRHEVESFGIIAYFICDQSGKGNISRIGSKQGSNRTSKGSMDLRTQVPNKMATGGFQMSDHFKSMIGAIAVLDRNDDIVVEADNRDRRIAVVTLDFWKVMAIVMDVDSDSPYDFTITDCQPLNTKGDCTDFAIEVVKSFERRGGKNRKTTIDYSSRNKAVMYGHR